MNEDLEFARADATKKVLVAMAEIVENKEKSHHERLEAATVVRGISQDLILSDLSTKGLDQEGDFKKKLLDKADKLDGKE